MKLLKFLLGILLAQLAAIILFVLWNDDFTITGILRLTIPLFFISLSIAFWFRSMAQYHAKEDFTQEKEKIRVQAEKEKIKIIKASQKKITQEATKTHAKANFKVGAAFAGALGIGALFIFAQMVTAGLLAITATGGVMGGYYWRGKRIKKQLLKELQAPYIDTVPEIKIIKSIF